MESGIVRRASPFDSINVWIIRTTIGSPAVREQFDPSDSAVGRVGPTAAVDRSPDRDFK